MVFFFLWCAVWFLLTRRWKSVYLEGNVLSVSNYVRGVKISLTEVDNVEASSWWGRQPRTVTVRLKSATEFGDSIVFVPRGAGMSAGRIADELRWRIEALR